MKFRKPNFRKAVRNNKLSGIMFAQSFSTGRTVVGDCKDPNHVLKAMAAFCDCGKFTSGDLYARMTPIIKIWEANA